MPRSKQLYGICKICREYRKLSWDHVPPKACGNTSPVVVEKVWQLLAQGETPKGKIQQKGVGFPSICENCNNTVLGKWYDPYLAEFCQAVKRHAQTCLSVPRLGRIECFPNLVLRAVLGHLLAAKRYNHWSELDNEFAAMVLNRHYESPKSISVYIWLYPHIDTFVLRDFSVKLRGRISVCSFMAFFPVAFLVASLDRDHGESPVLDVPCLDAYQRWPHFYRAAVNIPMYPIKPYGWPWHPDFSGLMLVGDEFHASNKATLKGLRARRLRKS